MKKAPEADDLSRTDRDFAVVIGIDHYPYFRSLQGAIDDAKSFREWLCDPDGGGLDPANVRLILSDPVRQSPVQDDIDRSLLEMLEQVKARGGARRLYFYFSGHGATNFFTGDDVALLLARWSPTFAQRALSVDRYASVLRSTGMFEEVAIFLDCCRSTSVLVSGMEPAFQWTWEKGPYATRAFMGHATGDGRPAFESVQPELWDGIFTRCLLSVLRGSRSGVGASELERLLTTAVAAEAARRGHVSQRVHVRNGLSEKSWFGRRGQLPVLEVRFLVRRGPVVLRNGKLEIVAEHIAGEDPWKLQLPRGLYKLEGGGEVPVVFRHGGQGESHDV